MSEPGYVQVDAQGVLQLRVLMEEYMLNGMTCPMGKRRLWILPIYHMSSYCDIPENNFLQLRFALLVMSKFREQRSID